MTGVILAQNPNLAVPCVFSWGKQWKPSPCKKGKELQWKPSLAKRLQQRPKHLAKSLGVDWKNPLAKSWANKTWRNWVRWPCKRNWKKLVKKKPQRMQKLCSKSWWPKKKKIDCGENTRQQWKATQRRKKNTLKPAKRRKVRWPCCGSWKKSTPSSCTSPEKLKG